MDITYHLTSNLTTGRALECTSFLEEFCLLPNNENTLISNTSIAKNPTYPHPNL